MKNNEKKGKKRMERFIVSEVNNLKRVWKTLGRKGSRMSLGIKYKGMEGGGGRGGGSGFVRRIRRRSMIMKSRLY